MNFTEALDQAKPPERVTVAPDLPTGMTASIDWDGNTGTITTGAVDTKPDDAVWRHLIADWGLNPDLTEVVDGSVKVKGWDSPVKGTKTGEKIRLLSYTATIRARHKADDRADVEALCRIAERQKPPKKQAPPATDCERAMVAAMADWQLGKGEGDGSEGTVNRISEASARLVHRLAELRKVGRGVDVVYLVGLGDLVEGCSGHYEQQTFGVDLTRREQAMVARRLIKQLVDFLVDAGYRVVLTAVAGNHGENRGNGSGKSFTTFEDNDDLAVVEQVGEIIAANPDRYGGVTVFLPTELSMTLDICGVPVGFAHGHQTRGGATPAVKVANWWRDQIVGYGATADAQILVTGHYQHLVVSESSGRTHLQCPAMDPGSRWWTEMSGQSSPAGLLTFCVGEMYGPRGYGDLVVL